MQKLKGTGPLIWDFWGVLCIFMVTPLELWQFPVVSQELFIAEVYISGYSGVQLPLQSEPACRHAYYLQ